MQEQSSGNRSKHVTLFRESFVRITQGERRTIFFDRFYERFMGADETVAPYFEHTDFERQHEVLRWSLLEMANFYIKHGPESEIDRLAISHGPDQLNIPIRLYDVWLDSLVATVKDVDPECEPEVELAWRLVMAPGIAYMKWSTRS